MHKLYSLMLTIFVSAVLVGSTGCKTDLSPYSERPVAKVSAEYIYNTNLSREVKHSRSVIRTRERNDFFGFSPMRELMLMRDNLGYLIERTALVLPAGALSQQEIKAIANVRAKELAEDIYDRLIAGESWDELSEEYSSYEGKDNGGIMPSFERDYERMPRAFFNISPGDVYGPVETVWGFDIFRLDEITEGPNGEELYNARRILILPDEKVVKAEMIDDVLRRKQVEILDPVIKAYDMYIRGKYDDALVFLKGKVPTRGWVDLGYYVLALCAKAAGDADSYYEYLLKAKESAAEAGTLLPYYEIEIGDIFREKGDGKALEHYRAAYDSSSNDYDIVVMLIERFDEIGDEEYAGIARNRKKEMEAYMKSNPPEPSDGVIMTGDVTPDKPKFEDI